MVGALAVVYASIGDGAWTRRSAIAWMIGSWGARLAVQGLYTRGIEGGRHDQTLHPPDTTSDRVEAAGDSPKPPATARELRAIALLVLSAIVCSVPALLAAFNRAPELSPIELAAAGIWLVGFAGETTADRQRLRFETAGHQTQACRTGVWRYSRHADRVFTAMVWTAFAMFGVAALWRV
jgi:steroid 5-alpha reductase family enzyme